MANSNAGDVPQMMNHWTFFMCHMELSFIYDLVTMLLQLSHPCSKILVSTVFRRCLIVFLRIKLLLLIHICVSLFLILIKYSILGVKLVLLYYFWVYFLGLLSQPLILHYVQCCQTKFSIHTSFWIELLLGITRCFFTCTTHCIIFFFAARNSNYDSFHTKHTQDLNNKTSAITEKTCFYCACIRLIGYLYTERLFVRVNDKIEWKFSIIFVLKWGKPRFYYTYSYYGIEIEYSHNSLWNV